MEINFEVLNYLNLINEKFGKAYKKFKVNPLPNDFVLSEDLIKERLALNELSKNINLPKFIFENKKEIKNNYKKSLKNTIKIEKFLKNSDIFDDFYKNKILLFLNLRKILLRESLKDFKNTNFNEENSFKEIYSIDPVLSEFMSNTFVEDVDAEALLKEIKEKYPTRYKNLLEEINNKKLEKENLKLSKIVEKSNSEKAKTKKIPIKQKATEKQSEITKHSVLEKTSKQKIKSNQIEKENLWYKHQMFL